MKINQTHLDISLMNTSIKHVSGEIRAMFDCAADVTLRISKSTWPVWVMTQGEAIYLDQTEGNLSEYASCHYKQRCLALSLGQSGAVL